MNKKHGVGCSLLAYNLGRLFDFPIYVDKESYMLDDEHKHLFPKVSKITSTKKHGIFDIGADLEKTYTKKMIRNAKLIVIPFEYGYESMIKTIQTLKYIEYCSDRKIPTLLILNRLDKQDSDRDFNYTGHMKEKFREEGIEFSDIFNENDTGNFFLGYLRNSYSLQSNLESGEYFLDKMYNKDHIRDVLNDVNDFRYDTHKFDYMFFLYIARAIIEQVNYENEEIYNQDKDMVVFRNNFSDKYINKYYPQLGNKLNDGLNKYIVRKQHASISDLKNNTYVHNKETKLIKDMAYIGYLVDILSKAPEPV